VRCVEGAIELCFRLKQEVGSYALMAGSGFEHLDMLQCCKFAEGDSRILMQKMARDAMGQFGATGAAAGRATKSGAAADALCAELAAALKEAKDTGGAAAHAAAWDTNFRTVYAIADAVMDADQAAVGSVLGGTTAVQPPSSSL
jgi:acyl-CoA oxidase